MIIVLAVMVTANSLCAAQPPAIDDQTALRIEALSRLKGTDLEANPTLKGAVMKVLEKTRGTPHFVELVSEFKLPGHGQALLEYALDYPNQSSGVEAFRLAVAELGTPAIQIVLGGATKAAAVVQLIGNSNEKELHGLLRALVVDAVQPVHLRKEAVKALCRSQDCAEFLLSLAEKGDLPADLKLAASSELNRVSWPHVKKAAAELLPLPQAQGAEPLAADSGIGQTTGRR